MTDDRVRRMCLPVRDDPFMVLSVPAAVTGTCAQCAAKVWVDAAQRMPPGLPGAIELWCLNCAAADPAIGPTLAAKLKAALTAQRLGLPAQVWRVSRDEDR